MTRKRLLYIGLRIHMTKARISSLGAILRLTVSQNLEDD